MKQHELHNKRSTLRQTACLLMRVLWDVYIVRNETKWHKQTQIIQQSGRNDENTKHT